VIVADTSGLLAWFNAREPQHSAVREVVERGEALIVSPFVVAELDYLVATRLGTAAEVALLEELAGGAYVLPAFAASDLERAASVVRRYADQDIGIADASLVVLAERFDTTRILTLDRRHFDVIRSMSGEQFDVLPG
jgi:predicted nucleic acid-binding protein